jgi:hypothetical protein
MAEISSFEGFVGTTRATIVSLLPVDTHIRWSESLRWKHVFKQRKSKAKTEYFSGSCFATLLRYSRAGNDYVQGSRCNLVPTSLLMLLLCPSGHFPFKKKIQQHSKLPVYQLTLLTGAPGVSTAMLLYKLQSLLMMHWHTTKFSACTIASGKYLYTSLKCALSPYLYKCKPNSFGPPDRQIHGNAGQSGRRPHRKIFRVSSL